MSSKTLISILLSTFVCSIHSADFQNLDFEAANEPLVPMGQGYTLSTARAFPSWTAYASATPLNQVVYNVPTVSVGTVILIQLPSTYMQGDYYSLLSPGFDESTSTFVGVSLAQTGLVPADAQSILFQASSGASFWDIDVELNGQELALFPLQQNGDITLFGADVSSFAGTSAELRFNVDYGDGYARLDAISFSPVPVPEPSTWALLTVGILCLAGFTIRKRASC